MHHFRTKLVPGKKRPYKSWTFLVIPREVAMQWGPGQKAICGSISGHKFRGTASRGEGVVRMPITQDFREMAQLECGATVEVVVELDSTPRQIQIPVELRAVFKNDPKVAALFEKLPPSMRRAWATHVAEAKQAETRLRRATLASAGIRARTYP